MSNSLWPHESQHARPPCPSPTPGVHSDSCPLSQWCHPAISSSVIPFSAILHASKLMLKILQPRLQQYVHHELSDIQAGFRKGRGTRSNGQHPLDHGKSKRVPEKTSISALLTMPKPLTVWITINCGNSEGNGSTRPPDLPLEKSVCRSGSNS